MAAVTARPIRSIRRSSSTRSLVRACSERDRSASKIPHASARQIIAMSRGVGDVVLEEYAHHAQSDVVDGLAVDGRIAPGTRYAGGQKEEPRDIVLDDAALYQPRERGVVDVVGAPGRALDPVPGVVRPGCPRDVGQRGIEEPVFERRRIDEDELFEVRIYAFLQGQIHQYRAGEHGVERVSRETGRDGLAALLVKQQQDDLFGESQHALQACERPGSVSWSVGSRSTCITYYGIIQLGISLQTKGILLPAKWLAHAPFHHAVTCFLRIPSRSRQIPSVWRGDSSRPGRLR